MLAACTGLSAHAEEPDWSGTWYSYWKGGQALLTIEQAGDAVEGRYRPGNGNITGTVDGRSLRGTWVQAGAQGSFEFALAPDGQSFSGRFDGTAYWNGERLDGDEIFEPTAGSASPRATMTSILQALALAERGNGSAELALRRFLVFPDNEVDLRALNSRIARLLRLVSLSTFELQSMPDPGAEDLVVFEIGPDGTAWRFPLRLRRGFFDLWDLEVPEDAELDALEAALFAELAVTDFEAIDRGDAPSARQVVHDFLIGTETWREGGRDRALSTLDLSQVPESLRSVDGPLAAGYLRQIFDRIGDPVLQQVPSDPDRKAPVVLYENAGGRLVLERIDAPQAQDDPDDATAPPRWAFSAETLRQAPDIYSALQNLEPPPGIEPQPALTRAFWLRDRLRAISPELLRRTLVLENWQWIALILCVPVATFGSRLLAWAAGGLVGAGLRLGRAAPETHAALARAFGWPARWYAAGLIVVVLVRELGLRQEASAVANALAGLFTIVGGTSFIFHLVNAVTGSLARAAAKTRTNYDDIAVAVGGGVAKIAVVVGGIALCAELVGLPYEGVVATLGVGGLALGFAARDAVSNFISAGILLTDRPFKKGDLVEVDNLLGTVEDVGLRSTRLRTLDDTLVVIPNARISEDTVNNWGRVRHRRLRLTLHLALDTPLATIDQFVDGLRGLFRRHPRAIDEPLVALNDIALSGYVVVFSGNFEGPSLADHAALRHGFLTQVVALAGELGVTFAEGDGDRDLPLPKFIAG